MKTPIFYRFLLMGLLVCLGETVFGQDTSKNQKDSIYTKYDQAPEPPGGNEGFMEYLEKNVKFQEITTAEPIYGTVYISIIVEKDGKLSDVQIEKDNVGHGCGEEAERVLKGMPKWQPAKINGKPVRVRYIVPVKFTLH